MSTQHQKFPKNVSHPFNFYFIFNIFIFLCLIFIFNIVILTKKLKEVIVSSHAELDLVNVLASSHQNQLPLGINMGESSVILPTLSLKNLVLLHHVIF